MSFTTYATWIAGSILTAANLNQQVRDNGLILKASIADDGTLRGPLKGYRESEQTVAIVAGGITVDPLLGSHITVSLTADVTGGFTVVGGIPVNSVLPLIFHFLGDGTPRAITWWMAGYGYLRWPGQAPPVSMSGTAGRWDEILITGRAAIWEAKMLGMNV